MNNRERDDLVESLHMYIALRRKKENRELQELCFRQIIKHGESDLNMLREKIKANDLEYIATETRKRAYEIIACKGATYFGIAACVATMCEAIIFDQKLVVPLTCYVPQFDICLSMPCVLGENGIEQILPIPLNDNEQKKLEHSAQQLRKSIS